MAAEICSGAERHRGALARLEAASPRSPDLRRTGRPRSSHPRCRQETQYRTKPPSVAQPPNCCLDAKGAALPVLEPAVSTKDAAGPILVTVLGMVAEMERRFIRERQQAGTEAAKAKGVYKGSNPAAPVATRREMRKAGHGPTAIGKALGISRMSVHRALTGA